MIQYRIPCDVIRDGRDEVPGPKYETTFLSGLCIVPIQQALGA